MNVDDLVRIRIEEAARKVEAARRRRAELDATRQAGLPHRHAAKLRNLAERTSTATDTPATAPGDRQGPPQTAQQPPQAPEPQPATQKPSQPRTRTPDVSVTPTETTQ